MSIRKITVGSDYKGGMNYVTGQKAFGGTINLIRLNSETDRFEVWVTNDKKETTLSKSFPANMVSVEYSVDHLLEP